MKRFLLGSAVLLSTLVNISAFASGKTGAKSSAAATESPAKSVVEDPSATPTSPASRTAPDDATRCKPSCYHTERPAPNANKAIKMCGYFEKGIYQDYDYARKTWGEPYLSASGQESIPLPSCKFPKSNPGKYASLQAFARKDTKAQQDPGDQLIIRGDSKWERTDESDGVTSRRLPVFWYSKTTEFKTTLCGTMDPDVRCEAGGSPRTRAMNVIHYRTEEAKKWKAANKPAECQQAALEAIAVVRGNMKSVGEWILPNERERYQTRFDGTLSKKEMLAKMTAFGKEAESTYQACGGKAPIATTNSDEMSFEARW